MAARLRERSSQNRTNEPEELGKVLSHLFALRGYGQPRANQELQSVWEQCAGPEISPRTKVINYRNGVLKVAVGNSALLGELTAFRKSDLLAVLARDAPRMRIRDIKFQLRSDICNKD